MNNRCVDCKYASYKHKVWACSIYKMAFNPILKACEKFIKKK